MKSNLNKKEFQRRLTELTSKEKDFYFITSYNSSGTPFCGTHDDKTFELTRNSFWRHFKTVIIKGEYKDADNNSTEVTYEVGLSKFARNFSLVFAGLIFVGLNIFLLVIRDKVKISLFLTVNGFLAFGCLLGLTINWVTKKIVNQRFEEEFEIGIKNERTTHTDSLIYRRLTKPPSP